MSSPGKTQWRAWAPWMGLALCLTAAVPLLAPEIPPLMDVPGHMGRYRIMLGIGQSPALAAAFQFKWQLIGNLGVDLLMVPLGHAIGIELATKLIAMAIPALTVAGILWLAREVHGRAPPMAVFALPLVYAYPFQLGFLNFILAVALVFNGMALWLMLGRRDAQRARALLFAVIASLIWLVHLLGWALLGLSVLGMELARRRRAGEAWFPAATRAAMSCLPLALPLAFMLLGQRGTLPVTAGGWNLAEKGEWVASLLRDRWLWLDCASAIVIYAIIACAIGGRRLRGSPLMWWPAGLCAVAFLALPPNLIGASYADMRILPFAAALAIIGIEVPPDRRAAEPFLKAAGLAFFGLRVAAATLSLAMYDASYRDELRALQFVPRGASVLVLVERPCTHSWSTPRLDHLGGIAILRRDAFVNEQWAVAGSQLLSVRRHAAAPFEADPSQHVYAAPCPKRRFVEFDDAIALFNRDVFDYVWTLGFPAGRAHAADLQLRWNNRGSALYEVGDGAAKAAQPPLERRSTPDLKGPSASPALF